MPLFKASVVFDSPIVNGRSKQRTENYIVNAEIIEDVTATIHAHFGYTEINKIKSVSMLNAEDVLISPTVKLSQMMPDMS